jgi:hypothetical protein
MTPITRVVLFGAVITVGLSVIPVAALSGSFLATHAVSAAMRKADVLALAAAPQPSMDRVAVNIPAGTATR